MPLSKKYYQMIADVLKGVREDFEQNEGNDPITDATYRDGWEEIWATIVRRLGDQFNADNPRFNFSRFEKWVFNQFPHVRKDQS